MRQRNLLIVIALDVIKNDLTYILTCDIKCCFNEKGSNLDCNLENGLHLLAKIKTTASSRMSDETPQREESYPNDYNKATNMPEEKFNKVIMVLYSIITSFITL